MIKKCDVSLWWKVKLFLSILSLLSATVQAKEAQSFLRVAVASNFTSALTNIEQDFTEATGVQLVIVSGASGVFYAQIVNGAPFDVFLSADVKRPLALVERGLSIDGKSLTYTYGQLVWWQPQLNAVSLKAITQYKGTIAIANPNFAPYGVAANSVVNRLANPKQIDLVKANNVAQAFQLADSGNVQVALVAKSLILQAQARFGGDKYRNTFVLPSNWYEPIEQQLVILKRSQNPAAARRFVDFLLAPNTQQKLTTMGYQ